MFKQIVVPLDESSYSERALSQAQELAKVTGARIALLNVLTHIGPTDDPEVVKLDGMARHRADRYMEKRVDAIRAAGVADVDAEVCFGNPADEILRFAKERSADLIAMTTHGQGGDRRYPFGSVAMKVLSAASCPVYLVRIES